MFIGTMNKLDVTKLVLIETYHIARFDPKYLSNDCFSIIIIRGGSLTAHIKGVDIHIQAPAVLCLDESKSVRIITNCTSDVRIIKFDPQFLNVNMPINAIRSRQYEHLCEQHALFQLSPFLTTNIRKISFSLNADILERFEISFAHIVENLEKQQDWYWACRARSYFIDIINILERLYHNFYLEESCDYGIKMAISGEFKMLLAYINTHLDEKQTLDSLYAKFWINKNQIENLFREHLNTTFYEYLRQRRYEEAMYYLRFTELDGEQIAARVGFSSSQNFCKFFKQMSGTTPNRYRKEMVSKRKGDPAFSQFAGNRQ